MRKGKKHLNVVAAVMRGPDGVFCFKRKSHKLDYLSNKYEFPGGKVEAGEDKTQALKRELKEELNAEVEVMAPLIELEHEYPDFSITLTCYCCNVKKPEFKLQAHEEVVSVAIENLHELDWLQADLFVVEKLRSLELHLDLKPALKTGFIDQTLKSSLALQPIFVRNDKQKGAKVLSYINRKIDECDEFWISAAFLTAHGEISLHNAFKQFAQRKNARGKVFVSDYMAFTQPEALRRIRQFENIETRLLRGQDYHGKGYLFREGMKYDCLIGSSNLTASALSTNEELNLHVSASENSSLVTGLRQIYDENFDKSELLTDELIAQYLEIFQKRSHKSEQGQILEIADLTKLAPNLLQTEAMENLVKLRKSGANKALVISATGTGKTLLSAFDAQAYDAKRLLFVVHRRNIAEQAKAAFQKIFGAGRSMGIYSGEKREAGKDFLFSTVQTINKDKHLKRFKQDEFDYIIIDESHRAGATSYEKILSHFSPRFLLGMTATPERPDGYDIFAKFDNNIGCEIRLERALREELLIPFHYFGISDLEVDGCAIDDKSNFNQLVSAERIEHIINALDEHGCDSGGVRGLVFCSRVAEAEKLSAAFNRLNFKTVALSGSDSKERREDKIRRIESDDPAEKLDYIFTVDIFNEGIDIPRINQVVMLRPTESAIIFVQQLGRGLRKANGKEYLTIIDFIGNYQNNYLIPAAIYGDSSFEKDTLRNLISSGAAILPGSSTVNFDEISKKRIYAAIDGTNMLTKRALRKDYKLMKIKLGRNPMMMDFHLCEARNPYQFVKYSGSFYNFALAEEIGNGMPKLPEPETKLLEHLCKYVNCGVRGLESLLLAELVENAQITHAGLLAKYKKLCGAAADQQTVVSALNCLNLGFHKERQEGKFKALATIYGYQIAKSKDKVLIRGKTLKAALKSPAFKEYLLDSARHSQASFEAKLAKSELADGFIRYKKYTRSDVFRILNWQSNPEPMLNVGGYKISPDGTNCPIFVTYRKNEDIAETSKYEDEFLSPDRFSWMSRSNRTLASKEVAAVVAQPTSNIKLPLFVKKSDDEGIAHYFIGYLKLLEGSAREQKMKAGNGKEVSVVNSKFSIDKPVEHNLYKYLTA